MTKYLLTYGAVLVTLLAVDAVWLGLIARTFYRARIGHLMSDGFSLAPAAVFYLLFVAGILLLVVVPASSLGRAFAFGALLGLIAYGTYDLTNQAVLRQWPLSVTLVDMAWGMFLTSLASGVGYLAFRS